MVAQCAAVRTCLLLMMEAPHLCCHLPESGSSKYPSEAIQGHGFDETTSSRTLNTKRPSLLNLPGIVPHFITGNRYITTLLVFYKMLKRFFFFWEKLLNAWLNTCQDWYNFYLFFFPFICLKSFWSLPILWKCQEKDLEIYSECNINVLLPSHLKNGSPFASSGHLQVHSSGFETCGVLTASIPHLISEQRS